MMGTHSGAEEQEETRSRGGERARRKEHCAVTAPFSAACCPTTGSKRGWVPCTVRARQGTCNGGREEIGWTETECGEGEGKIFFLSVCLIVCLPVFLNTQISN